jgi:RNA polymerase sigma-70 factor (ECF subfamily)
MVMEALAAYKEFSNETNTFYDNFSDFYDEYFPRVHRYVLYRIGDYHEADDLTSQIMLKVFEKRSLYCSYKAPLYGWVFCIARNTLTDHYRKLVHKISVPLENEENIMDMDYGPEAIALINESKSSLHSAMKTLNEREREIIYHKYWGGMTNREIAKSTGLSESNIGVILFRAMRYLRDVMETQNNYCNTY